MLCELSNVETGLQIAEQQVAASDRIEPMETVEGLNRLRDEAAALKPMLQPMSKPDQARLEQVLHNIGETVGALLHGYQCIGPNYRGPKWADELSGDLHSALLNVRYSLCWDVMP